MTIPPAIPRKPQSTAPTDQASTDNNNNNNADKPSPQPAESSSQQQAQNTAAASTTGDNAKKSPKAISSNAKMNAIFALTRATSPLICHPLTQVALATVPEHQQLNVVQQLQQQQQRNLQQVQQQQPMPKQQEPAQVPKKVSGEQQLQQPQQPTDVLQVRAGTPKESYFRVAIPSPPLFPCDPM